jgi:hypothetical protein
MSEHKHFFFVIENDAGDADQELILKHPDNVQLEMLGQIQLPPQRE